MNQSRRNISPYEARLKNSMSNVSSYQDLQNQCARGKMEVIPTSRRNIAKTIETSEKRGNERDLQPPLGFDKHKKEEGNIIIRKTKKDEKVLNDFKNFIKSGSPKFSKSNAKNISSGRYTRRAQPISRLHLNKSQLRGTRNFKNPLDTNPNLNNRTNEMNNSANLGQRPKIRKSINMNFLLKDRSARKPKDQIQMSLLDPSFESRPDNFTKSKRKIFDKSSGVYGNFAVLNSLEKELGKFEDRKNRSIIY